MSLKNALLGFLNYRPMTGYELKGIFDNTVDFIWTAQISQIYMELNKLETKGLVKSTIKPQEKKPDRKVYQITKKGEKVFLSWLNKFPSQLIDKHKSRFLMHFYFSSRIELNELAFEIKRYKKELEEKLKTLGNIYQRIQDYEQKKQYQNENFYWILIIKKEYKNVNSNIMWADECLRSIEHKQKEKKEE